MKRTLIGIFAAISLLAAGTVWAAGEEEGAAAEATPEVYIWPTIGNVTAQGSPPEVYERVQQAITDAVGVKPVGHATDPYSPEFRTKLNLALSSGNPRIDVFTGNWPEYLEAVQPINQLLDDYGPNIKAAFPELWWNGMTDSDGNIWGIPRLGIMAHTFFTWFQQDMLDAAGMELPTRFEDLEGALLEMREVNPDAVMLSSGFEHLRNAWAGAFVEGGNARWLDDQGNMQLPEFAPGYRDFIATMAEWYDQGYFHPDTFVKHDDTEIIKRGNVGIFAGWYSRITVNVQRLIAAGGFDKTYVFPKPLMSDNGPSATNFISLTAAFMISKDSPDPVAAMKLMNWQFDTDNPENAATAEYGVKGIDWEWEDPANPYFIRRLSQDYVSEFMVATSLPISILYAPDSEDLKKHYLHMKDYQYEYDFGKMPFDYYVPYDFKAAQDNVGAWSDITRMLSEEQVKFIMGIRPMAEWDDFLNELKKAGYDKVSAEYTRQYNIHKK